MDLSSQFDVSHCTARTLSVGLPFYQGHVSPEPKEAVMRHIVTGTLILLSVFVLSGISAAENQMGIKDLYKVSFLENVKVADTVLPAGNYEIRHVMEGPNHIMVFRQVGTKKPVEVRTKCTLVPLPEKATRDEKIYAINASNTRVLQELIFRGDTSKHVF
jgi:hypothetical protein